MGMTFKIIKLSKEAEPEKSIHILYYSNSRMECPNLEQSGQSRVIESRSVLGWT